MTFLFAAGWGIIVLIGLIGWGSLLLKLVRPDQRMGWGLSGAIGFSFSVFIGGLLGLVHLIISPVVVTFVISGAVLGVIDFILHRPKRLQLRFDGITAALAIILICLTALRYFASVSTTALQPLDDIPAYLVFPVKMLQTGQFAPDPFSDRRMTGLGGQPWSQSMVLALFDPTSVNLFDHGVMLILLLALVGSWLLSIRMTLRFALLMQLVLVLFYPIYLNCCNFVTISLLILSLFVVLLDRIEKPREAFLIGLIVAGLCSLKSTAIPYAGIILTVYFFFRAIESRSLRPLLFAVAVAILNFVFLLPWMTAMRASSGTFLCPFLGRGNSLLPSLAGTMPHAVGIKLLLLSIVIAGAGLLILVCLWKSSAHRNWAHVGAVFMMAISFVGYVVAANTGGASWMRYSQPFFYGLLPLPIAACWIWSDSGLTIRRFLGKGTAIILGIGLIFVSVAWLRPLGPITAVRNEFTSIHSGLSWPSITTAREAVQVKALQDSVPPGVPILERLDYPHLMNFKRNPIYINDHPGLAAPPPGLPDRPNPEELQTYLLTRGVRYIAYSYGDEARFPAAENSPDSSLYAWNRLVAVKTLGMQDAFIALSKSRKVIYDDGFNIVIDLAAIK